MKLFIRALAAAGALAFLPAVIHAHFKLVEPASWLIEDDRGDPQKAGPCGGSNADWGKPSYAVTQAVGGSKFHVKVQETIYHPGFYRVALAVNSPAELPPDPKATTVASERGPQSVSGEVMSPVQMPVLADGLFMHHERVDDAVRDRRHAAEHQLQALHAAGDSVHGAARRQQPGHLHVSPLRRRPDHGRCEEADRRGVAEGAVER